MIIAICYSWVTLGQQFTAQQIIDKAIEEAGSQLYEESIVRFTFRKKQYRSERKNGRYRLERFALDDAVEIHDVLDNKGLNRSIENCQVKVADSMVTRISDGVNSVHYFANLPFGLNASAVNKELLGEGKIKNESYYKIKITFNQEGGGTDYEDEFLYWVHKKNFTIDYLAYKYAVNGGGVRFREAYNPRVVNGIRFVDYRNYKTENLKSPLSILDKDFENNKLKLLSTIALEDIYVYIK